MIKILKQTSFLVFLAVFLIIFLPGYAKIQELRQKNRDLETNIKNLTKENIVLQEEKKKMQNDPVYLEQVARERLGIIKKGETLYKMIPEVKKK